MALELAFEDLSVKVRALADAFLELRLTSVVDKPEGSDVLLADSLGDSVDDLLGRLRELSKVAEEGHQAVQYPIDLERGRHALTTCQERYNYVVRHFSDELVSYERIADLRELGENRRGEWAAWVRTVEEALDRCREPLHAVSLALFFGWREITERLGFATVSVQTTNIGQHIGARELASEPLA